MNPDRLAILSSLRFFGRNLIIVIPLCGATAIARFAQTGYPALDGVFPQIVFEILVGAGRIAFGVAVIGQGSLRAGIYTLRRFLALPQAQRLSHFTHFGERFRSIWRSLVIDLVLFALIALGLNAAIRAFSDTSSAAALAAILGGERNLPLSIELLLKNLSVIPLTIAFQIHLAARLWLRRTTSADLDHERSPTRQRDQRLSAEG